MTTKPDYNRFRVFVYGTLKRGFSNHKVLARNHAEYLGNATTRDSYVMFDVGYPLIIKDNSLHNEDTAPVVGEIYLVNRQCMKELDILEGEGILYKRIKIKLFNHEDALAYLWIGEPEGTPVMPNMTGVIDWR